mmetsp:Transcript_107410/g.175683  ORF Transcript_107410/g.175683 Transcript_107410/m.175683 type:complete len:207 (+) Transcript_107410:1536-2156(+)
MAVRENRVSGRVNSALLLGLVNGSSDSACMTEDSSEPSKLRAAAPRIGGCWGESMAEGSLLSGACCQTTASCSHARSTTVSSSKLSSLTSVAFATDSATTRQKPGALDVSAALYTASRSEDEDNVCKALASRVCSKSSRSTTSSAARPSSSPLFSAAPPGAFSEDAAAACGAAASLKARQKCRKWTWPCWARSSWPRSTSGVLHAQ